MAIPGVILYFSLSLSNIFTTAQFMFFENSRPLLSNNEPSHFLGHPVVEIHCPPLGLRICLNSPLSDALFPSSFFSLRATCPSRLPVLKLFAGGCGRCSTISQKVYLSTLGRPAQSLNSSEHIGCGVVGGKKI